MNKDVQVPQPGMLRKSSCTSRVILPSLVENLISLLPTLCRYNEAGLVMKFPNTTDHPGEVTSNR